MVIICWSEDIGGDDADDDDDGDDGGDGNDGDNDDHGNDDCLAGRL